MKKFFKKFLMLLCVITLFIAPQSAFAADSTPVLTLHNDTTTLYTFQPNPYELGSLNTLSLSNGTQYWMVPAGKTFSFCCYYEAGKQLTFRVAKFIPAASMVETYEADGQFVSTIPASDQDAIYMVYVYNPSYSSSAKIINYFAIIQ